MYPTLKELYLELRRTFPMLPASQMLKSARSSIALRERLLAKVRSNKACSGFATLSAKLSGLAQSANH